VAYRPRLYRRDDLLAVLNLLSEQIDALIDIGWLILILICGEERFDSRDAFQLIDTYSELRRAQLNAPSPPESIVVFLRSLRRHLMAKEGARILSYYLETFYGFIGDGLLAERRGRRWRIDPIKFAEWLEARGFATPAATQMTNKPAERNTK